MIAGSSPTLTWRPNPDGQARTIEEAIEVAKQNGVRIPADIAFFVDEFADLGPNITARGPNVTKPTGGQVVWSDLVHDRTGKVPFLIRPDIPRSDEAIVAVIAHEVHEIQEFRKVVGRRGWITIEEFIAHHAPDNPGNLHDEAWDLADALVRRMRGESP